MGAGPLETPGPGLPGGHARGHTAFAESVEGNAERSRFFTGFGASLRGPNRGRPGSEAVRFTGVFQRSPQRRSSHRRETIHGQSQHGFPYPRLGPHRGCTARWFDGESRPRPTTARDRVRPSSSRGRDHRNDRLSTGRLPIRATSRGRSTRRTSSGCARTPGPPRRAAGVPPREGPALLQGLALCGLCGARMTVRYQGGKETPKPYYVCKGAGNSDCGPTFRRLDGRARLPNASMGGRVALLGSHWARLSQPPGWMK